MKISTNRFNNFLIILSISIFLIFIKLVPVACFFKSATGISCPSCGMTRAFLAILRFDFLEACYQNLLSIPLFLFILLSILMLIKDLFQNRFSYIPSVLKFLEQHAFLIITLLLFSFLFNNLKA